MKIPPFFVGTYLVTALKFLNQLLVASVRVQNFLLAVIEENLITKYKGK
jgi:hypothetical protein